MNPEDVKKAQTNLKAKGYEIGAIDGDFGPKTLAGIMALVAGRRIDAQLLEAAAPLVVCMKKSGIIGPYRIGHFIANLSHESAGFERAAEILGYTDAARLLAIFPSRVKDLADAKGLVRAGAVAIGNRVYANKNGNGDEASGDGFRYKGRGWIGTTGRANYAALVSPLNADFLRKPELLEQPTFAALSAAHYWTSRNLNVIADRNDQFTAKQIRVAINGQAALGLSDTKKGADRIISLFVS